MIGLKLVSRGHTELDCALGYAYPLVDPYRAFMASRLRHLPYLIDIIDTPWYETGGARMYAVGV